MQEDERLDDAQGDFAAGSIALPAFTPDDPAAPVRPPASALKAPAQPITREEMRTARPVRLPGGSRAEDAARETPSVRALAIEVPESRRYKFPFVTTGKLFFREAGVAAQCTAASIGNFAVWTAGHCIYTAQHGWNTDFTFVPAYRDGPSSHGTWSQAGATQIFTTQAWVNAANRSYDFGGVILARNADGKKISAVVGALGFTHHQPLHTIFRMLGYADNPPYTGQRLLSCHLETSLRDGNLAPPQPVGGSPCDQGNGASGGPWIVNGALGGSSSYRRNIPALREFMFSPSFQDDTRKFRDFLLAQKATTPCNTATESGGAGVTTRVYEMGQPQGTFRFTYEAYTLPDTFELFYEGDLLHSTGVVSGSGDFTEHFGPGTSTQIKVVVTGQDPDTAWTYTLYCPD
jgi:hypothetical protein